MFLHLQNISHINSLEDPKEINYQNNVFHLHNPVKNQYHTLLLLNYISYFRIDQKLPIKQV